MIAYAIPSSFIFSTYGCDDARSLRQGLPIYVPRFPRHNEQASCLEWIVSPRQHGSAKTRNFPKTAQLVVRHWPTGVTVAVRANAAGRCQTNRAALNRHWLRQCETGRSNPDRRAGSTRLVPPARRDDKPGLGLNDRHRSLARAIRLLGRRNTGPSRALRCSIAGISLGSPWQNRLTGNGRSENCPIGYTYLGIQISNAATANLNDHSWKVDVDGNSGSEKTFDMDP